MLKIILLIKNIRLMELSVDLSDRLVCDLELLLDGSFSPLDGFMIEKDYKSVVNKLRLSTGELWPIPIVLPISGAIKEKIKHENSIILRNSYNLPLARLYIKDIYKPNLDNEYKKVYGSTDPNHPYIKTIKEWEEKDGSLWYVGGRVEQLNNPPHYDYAEYRMSPEKVKIMYKEDGWKTIVGFHTQDPIHRLQYELTKHSLNDTGDPDAKLLIQPTVGITQDCDVDYFTRVKCYKYILDKYPDGTAKLSLIPLNTRMAGPREAILHALIRKNYGCTHFIIGKNHASPFYKKQDGTNFYGPYDAYDLLDKYKDELGIEIIKSKAVVYVEEIDEYRTIDNVPCNMTLQSISDIREKKIFIENRIIPKWFSYPEIINELKKIYIPNSKKGFCVYLVGLSGSGKTTVANILKTKFNEMFTRRVTILDGDNVRKNLNKGLGFDRESRSINVRRIGYVASEIVKHGGIVICANIAPYADDRNFNRKIISKYGGYYEVFVDTPLYICEKRDTQGLYKLARKGIIKNFTGISDPFEKPENPELVLKNYYDIKHNVKKILDLLRSDGYIK